jgi:hypothetical protein
MERINKPSNLPDCKIINTLIAKSNTKIDYEFDYIHQLEEFRKIIAIEVSSINLLFPEYTPHDEKYHLKRLFYVADQLLGDDIIENMNATELFLLALSLYGHDWGMAVSEEEKKFILSTDTFDTSTNLNLLDDEKNRITKFCKIKNQEVSNLGIEEWQEYVRLTHAFRSGQRIKNHFESISSGIADFGSRICEGHWLDFDIIDDHISYPTDASIHRETVNVKALTVYVRLIDLLDLGEDRTPYVLWKFVAPRNKYSKLEWSKHRALQPVTFPKYQQGRSIQVDGSTDNQDVYMSILDLKRYVDDQFRHCSDILNRVNHKYHKLDITHIDWRIASRGFEPVAIQFEFDRSRMFDILGDEIYQSNPYVFVRELIQNAIDAIRMRLEILEKLDLSFNPKISINIREDKDHHVVEISDNGIGMDEYIIRNYLTIAGKSYYRSSDFKKEGLKMDPISRFGIGVLSCFMCADYIEVNTLKDPNTTKNQDHIEISIPSKENYFKIRKNYSTLTTGTTFKVFLIKDRLPIDTDTKSRITFNVTEYLKNIAGFVKYPISINENGEKAIVTNPNIIGDSSSTQLRIKYDFPIDKAILPQNKDVTQEYFVEKKINLKDDLNLDQFDGCLTYLLPKSDNIDIENVGRSWPTNEVKLVNFKNEIEKKTIKWNREWISFERGNHMNKDKFSIPSRCYKVYMDGILIQDISAPQIDLTTADEITLSRSSFSLTDSFVNPQLIVNIPKPLGLKIDLARTSIESSERWDRQIWLAFYKYLENSVIKDIKLKEPKEKLLGLAKLITFYKVSISTVLDFLISDLKYPLPSISSSGELTFQAFEGNKLKSIKIAPEELKDEFIDLIQASYIDFKSYDGILKLWKGETVVANLKGFEYRESIPASISNLSRLTKEFIRRHYYLDSVEFIYFPLGSKFPLAQQVLSIIPEGKDKTVDTDKVIKMDIDSIDEFSCSLLNKFLKEELYSFPALAKFKTSYKSKSFYGFKYLNINDVKIRCLIKLCVSVITAKNKKNVSEEVSGKLIDMINDLGFIKSNSSDMKIKLDIFNSHISKIYQEAQTEGIINANLKLSSEFNFSDFVTNSIKIEKITNSFTPSSYFNNQLKKYKKKIEKNA